MSSLSQDHPFIPKALKEETYFSYGNFEQYGHRQILVGFGSNDSRLCMCDITTTTGIIVRLALHVRRHLGQDLFQCYPHQLSAIRRQMRSSIRRIWSGNRWTWSWDRGMRPGRRRMWSAGLWVSGSMAINYYLRNLRLFHQLVVYFRILYCKLFAI